MVNSGSEHYHRYHCPSCILFVPSQNENLPMDPHCSQIVLYGHYKKWMRQDGLGAGQSQAYIRLAV